jgi:hypothetical protein
MGMEHFVRGNAMTTKPDLAAIVPELRYEADFVPQRKSRNAGEKERSLNWKVTLSTPGGSLTTDYMQGIGHMPGYQQSNTVEQNKKREEAAEFGTTKEPGQTIRGKINGPDLCDVMHSLLTDLDVLDHPAFESWAADLGYDTDSRKAEATYRACLEIALKLRAMLGDSKISELREAFQDY